MKKTSKFDPTIGSGFIFYPTEDGQQRIRVHLEGTTVWLSQAMMAALFQTSVANINTHIKGILGSGEMSAAATIKESLIVQNEAGRM